MLQRKTKAEKAAINGLSVARDDMIMGVAK